MNKFKKGDKVKIPTQKTYGDPFHPEEFRPEWKYVIISYPWSGEVYVLAGPNGENIRHSIFHERDLHSYDEYTIEYLKSNKIAVHCTSKEQAIILSPDWSNTEQFDHLRDFYIRLNNRIYGQNGWASDKDFYTVREYKIIEFDQVIFDNMSNKEITGYKCPMDLFGGNVKAGTIFVKGQGNKEAQWYQPKSEMTKGLQSFMTPKEIVETWEAVYEEEWKVGDWFYVTEDNPGFNLRTGDIAQVTEIVEGPHSDGLDWVKYEPVSSISTNRIRKATQEEIDSVLPKIGGYKPESNQAGVRFGCQQFSLSELKTIRRLFHRDVQTELKIHGTTISVELLDKIIKRIS